jgi:hypothetical protein
MNSPFRPTQLPTDDAGRWAGMRVGAIALAVMLGAMGFFALLVASMAILMKWLSPTYAMLVLGGVFTVAAAALGYVAYRLR